MAPAAASRIGAMKPVALLGLSLALAAAAHAQDATKVLTGVQKTAHFEIRYKPGSRAEASVDRVMVMAEKDRETILAELELAEFKPTIRLFLYDSVEELQQLTRVECGGFSAGLDSHVPHDIDQTRLHELVHVVAASMPSEGGTEKRNMFLVEGLANAIVRFVHGVHVDAVAAFYKKKGKLPSLAELLGAANFYEWLNQHPGFNGYDVGGSFVRHLLDTYGPQKTRKHYGGVPAKQAFGADIPEIEKAWHKKLDAVVLRPGLLALLEDRDDPAGALKRSPEARLGPAVLGPASEWKSLDRAAVIAGDPGKWAPGDPAALLLDGEKSQGDWCVARLTSDPLVDAIVKCRLEAQADCYGVQVQLGPGCQAMALRGQGAFLYKESAGVAHEAAAPLGDKPVEIVLRRRGTRASAWIDGKLVLEGDVEKGPSVLGLGCVGGKAKVTGLVVRRL
jgi:hypothetical protein